MAIPPPIRHAPAVLMALVVSACGAGDRASTAVVRDSAGITIVENDAARPLWTEDTAWRLSADPLVSVGSAEGDSAYLIHQAFHARRLPDGSLAVANSGTADVRIYASDGRHVRTVGRRGNGPGEYRSPWAVYGAGDSVVVVDLYRKISVVRPDGPPREFAVGGGESEVPLGRFADGTLLFMEYVRSAEPLQEGQWRQVRLLRRTLDGARPRHLRTVDEYRSSGQQQNSFIRMAAALAAGDSSVWYARGDALSLEEMNLEGRVLRMARLPMAPVPLTDTHRERLMEALTEANPGVPMARVFENTLWPEFLPPHGPMVVDATGHPWVRKYTPWGSEQEPAHWYVFRPDGHYLGTVQVPGELTLHHIGPDWALGIHRDELGVERLQLWGIEKPEG